MINIGLSIINVTVLVGLIHYAVKLRRSAREMRAASLRQTSERNRDVYDRDQSIHVLAARCQELIGENIRLKTEGRSYTEIVAVKPKGNRLN